MFFVFFAECLSKSACSLCAENGLFEGGCSGRADPPPQTGGRFHTTQANRSVFDALVVGVCMFFVVGRDRGGNKSFERIATRTSKIWLMLSTFFSARVLAGENYSTCLPPPLLPASALSCGGPFGTHTSAVALRSCCFGRRFPSLNPHPSASPPLLVARPLRTPL